MLNAEVMSLIWSDTEWNGEDAVHIKITGCEVVSVSDEFRIFPQASGLRKQIING